MFLKWVTSLFFSFIFLLINQTECLAQKSISMFGNAVPNNPVEVDQSAVTLGVKFWSTTAGSVSAIHFYRGAASPQGYVATLFSATGTPLGSVQMSQESGPVPGWQLAQFATPISISPNTSYVAAYYAPSGQYADDYYGLSQGVVTGPLAAPASASVGGNGVYHQGNGFPNIAWQDSNYYVDVLFTPVRVDPYLQLSLNPPNPSIASNAPSGSVVATIAPSWSNGAVFTGTLSFGPPYSNDNATFAISGNNLIVNPAGPGVSGDANTVQNVTIVATSGNQILGVINPPGSGAPTIANTTPKIPSEARQ
jgi:hypothetical protein